jgi:methionyl-tRNA synthetase
VIGYLSATIEWAQIQGQADAWQDWWFNPEARAYYFIGKDNIPFHAIIWPGQLIGSGEWFGKLFANVGGKRLTLPYDVPANEFMNLEGKKISGSRNWAVWGNDFLSRYDPDPLRYYLTANMPETRDTDWDWQDFYQRNNSELVATWGNLANRVLSFAFKHWDGHVPDAGELRAVDQELLEKVRQGFQTVSEHLEAVRLRAALLETMNLASEVNKYLDLTGPWFEIKTDKDAAAKSIFTALRAIDTLKVLFAPFLPFSTEKIHRYLGYYQPFFGEQKTELLTDELGEHRVLLYDGSRASGEWKLSELPPGQALTQPAPLFKKLEEKIVAEERARLGA